MGRPLLARASVEDLTKENAIMVLGGKGPSQGAGSWGEVDPLDFSAGKGKQLVLLA